jgi:hypothetical protein
MASTREYILLAIRYSSVWTWEVTAAANRLDPHHGS